MCLGVRLGAGRTDLLLVWPLVGGSDGIGGGPDRGGTAGDHRVHRDGREVFRNALDSAGLATDRYAGDDEVEYDPVGEDAYGRS